MTVEGPLRRVRLTLRKAVERTAGALLLVLAFLPIYRVLDTTGEAPFRQASVDIADVTLELVWWGSLVTLLLAGLLARLGGGLPRFWARKALARIEAVPLPAYAVGTALLGFGLALTAAVVLFDGFYTNVDEIASRLNAEFLASGRLAGPLPGPPEAWLIPNTLMAEGGFVSQYPPAHLMVMALFVRLGSSLLVGPTLFAIMVGFTTLALPRLLPDRAGVARIAALLTAVSPFLVFLAGGALSHLTAGAAGAVCLYAALRARDGGWGWGLLAGAAVGMMVSSRPLIGLILGTTFTLGIWARGLSASGLAWWARRAAATVLGGVPFALGLGWYNHALFGKVGSFGYLAAFGEDHQLGFHRDPWGYSYQIGEALGFTSTDLLSVGVQFLETPLPLTALVAALLLAGRKLPRGGGPLMAWALLPVIGNAFYWFHASRMLFEAAPAWIALGVLAIAELGAEPDEGAHQATVFARNTVAWLVPVSLILSILWGVPERVRTYTWTQETLDRITEPALPDAGPALIFVHTSWNERLSATLQGAGGMRQDSVISALRRNTNCSLHRFAVYREQLSSGGNPPGPIPRVDLLQGEGTPPGIERQSVAPGATVRLIPGETITDACLREMSADRFGVVALAPLVWQGDLPGVERGRPLYVRDLGPEKNATLLAAFPERAPYVLVPRSPEVAPELVVFEEAMRVLWGG